MTVDQIRVELDNRLALSQTFTLTHDERTLLRSGGIASADMLKFFRFFINDFSSRTQGVDLVSTYQPLALGENAAASFTLNYIHTEVAEESKLLTRGDGRGLERGVPRMRWNFAVDQGLGCVGVLRRPNYCGA